MISSIASGTRLGPYEIVAPIGAGGMGQVYKAFDTRLDRMVAIKTLPPDYRADARLRLRFDREARTIASLNHPHICVLHDIGEQDGIAYLVMEYLDGETLAQRLGRGPLPIDELFVYAMQMADALDRAHRHGVIHRDLKPANVMLTRSGAKLLDFGLARSPVEQAFAADTRPPGDTPITAEGALVGTLQYMAPEQLEGRPLDARTDLFAFGAVLYEMATGERAFPGQTQATIIASILNHTPPLPSARQPVPPALDHIIARALAKEPEDRWQTARDLLLELRTRSDEMPPAPAAPPATRLPPIGWMLAVVVGVALVAASLFSAYLRTTASAPVSVRAMVTPPENMLFQLTGDFGGPPVVSPDGRSLVFAAVDPLGKRQLWIRRLDAITPEPLSGTEDASFPFWSPTGASVGFFASGKLKRLDLDGGSALTLCDAPGGRGGAWSSRNTIVFSPGVRGGLQQVSASGGSPIEITSVEGTKFTSHRWPQALPDGQHFVFLAVHAQEPGGPDDSAIFLGSLGGPAPQQIMRSHTQAEFAGGQLFFLRDRTLWAQPFTVESGRFSGAPTAVARDVLDDPTIWRAIFTVSDGGTVVYQTGLAGTALTAYDRSGHDLGAIGENGIIFDTNLSPDGSRVAVNRGDPADIWVYELSRGTSLRLTFDPRNETLPVWAPDGRSLAYSRVEADGRTTVMQVSASGGAPKALIPAGEFSATDWSRDGKYLLLRKGSILVGPGDIYEAPLADLAHPRPVLETPFAEYHARFSYDRRWISYVSNESGQDEVYVMAFRPDGDAGSPRTAAGVRVRISSAGGVLPRWRGDGTELFYVSKDMQMMAASLDGRGESLGVRHVAPLFAIRPKPVGWVYDVTADGQRFIVNSLGDEGRRPLVLVTNWQNAQQAAR